MFAMDTIVHLRMKGTDFRLFVPSRGMKNMKVKKSTILRS